jgi:hypothetical protein
VPSSRNLHISSFKFGVEIELGLDEDEFENDVELPDGWISHDEHCGVEVVSPPLMGRKGLLSVRECIRRIWEQYDEISFDDCGLHVHVDIQHFRLGHAKRLLKLGSRFDEVIYSIMDAARYNNHFCRHVTYADEQIDKCYSLDDFFKLQKNERYSGINFFAFSKHGTVEFRYAKGTANWQTIYSLISMYLRMIAFAGSSLPLPTVSLPALNGAGPQYQEMKAKQIGDAKNLFFDLLEIRGGVREVLDRMYEQNRLHVRRDGDEDGIRERRVEFPTSKRIKFDTGLRNRT